MWGIIGDINQVIKQEDKLGEGPVRGYSVDRMRRMFDVGGLEEVPFSGPKFTWSNNQVGRRQIQQRIDQCWGNAKWFDMLGKIDLQHLSRVHSDHSPLLLTIGPRTSLPNTINPFRFEAAWMEHIKFEEFMKEAWLDVPGDIIRTVEEFKEKA